jgi:hypothetical protein
LGIAPIGTAAGGLLVRAARTGRAGSEVGRGRAAVRFGSSDLTSMPSAAAMAGTFDAILLTAPVSAAVISVGGASGVTTRRTGDDATASTTTAHRSAIVSALSAFPAASARRVSSSGASLVPGSGGWPAMRSARTSRPPSIDEMISLTQVSFMADSRCKSASRS